MGEEIGRGACGKVYKGLNFKNGQIVAIKQIKINNFKEEHRKSLQSEINLLKKLEHPNIVKYIDSIYTDHNLNIILEYVENGSLDSLMRNFGKFPETLVAVYVHQVLQGLDYLHTQVVIHRDIKGANILTTKDGIVKLADFGVATKLNDSEKSNSGQGTPYWMAPEVIEMSGQVTQACDIWSLGCTIIELMTGNPPYSNLLPVPAMIKIVQEGIPPRPEWFTDELKDFLNKCFEKDPYRRIDAKGLLQHPWLKKYDRNSFQHIINNINNTNRKIPESVTNTIKLHINATGKAYNSMYQKVENQKIQSNNINDDASSQLLKSQIEGGSENCINNQNTSINLIRKSNTKQKQKQIEDLNQLQAIQVEERFQAENQALVQEGQIIKSINIPKHWQQSIRRNNEEDEDGELGDFGEEVNDMNDVPIERPKCLSNINFHTNSNEKYDQQNNQADSNFSIQPPISKIKKLQSIPLAYSVSNDPQPNFNSATQKSLSNNNQNDIRLNTTTSAMFQHEEESKLYTNQNQFHNQSISGMTISSGQGAGYSFIGMKNHNKQQSIQADRSTIDSQKGRNMNQKASQQSQSQFQQINLKQQQSINQSVVLQNQASSSSQQTIQSFSSQLPPQQQRTGSANRLQFKSQDKSAGPGSGDGGVIGNSQIQSQKVKQNFSQTPNNIAQTQLLQNELQNQHMNQVFDIQGNRKLLYLPKKNQKQEQSIIQNQIQAHQYNNSGNSLKSQDDATKIMSLNQTQRQKRQDLSSNQISSNERVIQKSSNDFRIPTKIQQQQQQLIQQNQLDIAEGLQYQIKMQGQQKPKSNEMIRSHNSPSSYAQQQFQQQIRTQALVNYHQHHMTAAPLNYQSNQNFQGSGYNFQFQHESQDFEFQNSQNIARHQSIQQQSPQYIMRNIQHQHNYTQMPQSQQYMFTQISDNDNMTHQIQNQNNRQINEQQLVSNLNKRKYTKQYDQRGMLINSNYHSGSNSSKQMIPIAYYDGFESENIDDIYLQQQDSDFSGNQINVGQQVFPSNLVDYQQTQFQNIQRKQNNFHHRFGSSFSQLGLNNTNFDPQNPQHQLQLQQIQSSIEDHIKKTQLSEQKLGRGHLTQLYGNASHNNQMFHHIQHKSVFSNFQGSNQSPKNMEALNQQQRIQAAQRGFRPRQDGPNGSFDNNFETISNYEDQFIFGTIGGNTLPLNLRTSIINMQNLKNVRESYSKKFAEQVKTAQEDQRTGMMMMFQMSPVDSDPTQEMTISSKSKRIKRVDDDQQIQQVPNLNKQNTNLSSIQLQSIGSARSNNSVQIHQDIDNEAMQQLEEECKIITIHIRQVYCDILKDLNSQNRSENTIKNQELENEDILGSKEQDLKHQISLLCDKVQFIKNESLKAQLANIFGYNTFLGLLNLSDEIIYPTLLLINQFSDKCPQFQDNLCICGFVQKMIQLNNPLKKREIVLDIGYFMGTIFQTQSTAFILFVGGGGCQIITDFLDFSYEENKDLITLAVDACFVLTWEKIDLFDLSVEDMTLFLSKYNIIEKISQIIPKLYQDIENSEEISHHEQMQTYLEKAFDVLLKMLSGPVEVVQIVATDSVMKNSICKVVYETLNDPSHYSVMILKKFIRILQITTQHQQLYNELENQGIVKIVVEMLQYFLNDIEHIELVRFKQLNTFQQIPYDTLKLINVLCKLSPSRTEKAAQASLIEYIFDFIEYLKKQSDIISKGKRTKLLKLMILIIQQFISSSHQTRENLWQNQIHDTLLSILKNQGNQISSKDQTINSKILDSFAMWMQNDNTKIEGLLSKRENIEELFIICFQNTKSKNNIQVLKAIKTMVYSSNLFAQVLGSNQGIVEKLIIQLLNCDKHIVQAEENSKKGKIHHHNKNSSSARSINDFGSLGSNINQTEDNTNNKNYYEQRISWYVNILKELMEIFTVVLPKITSQQVYQIDRNYLNLVFKRIVKTLEKQNFVILQQLAQNLLEQSTQSHETSIKESNQIQQQLYKQGKNSANSLQINMPKQQSQQIQLSQQQIMNMNQQTQYQSQQQSTSDQNISQQLRAEIQMKPQAMQLAQNMRLINTQGVNSTRAKSPLFQ